MSKIRLRVASDHEIEGIDPIMLRKTCINTQYKANGPKYICANVLRCVHYSRNQPTSNVRGCIVRQWEHNVD